MYPGMKFSYRTLIHRSLHPRTSPTSYHPLVDAVPMYILWSRDSSFDNTPGSRFQPKHFIPLISEKEEVTTCPKKTQEIKDCTGQKAQQATLSSFHIAKPTTESSWDEWGPSIKTAATVYGPKEVVRDMLIFNVDVWPTRTSDLMDYGREEIQYLTNWFKVPLEISDCNVQNIHDQWISLKITVNSQFCKMDYATLWETLLTKLPYEEDFADVLHLVEILLVLPIMAAQYERTVSSQNQIKSSTRATLNVAVLEDLIRLSCKGPPVADFDPDPAVNCWFERNKSKEERLRRPHSSVKKSWLTMILNTKILLSDLLKYT